MSLLKNKIILITGASSGMGKATAEQFAAQGAHVILAARRAEHLEKLAGELENTYKIKTRPLVLNIQDADAVKRAIESLPQDWREIDILVNSAGLVQGTDKIQDGKTENWDTMIQTNLLGLLYITRAVLPIMVARKSGHIFNVGSAAAHDHYLSGNIYCATKHAVRSLSKSLRIDLLGLGIRVTEIDPGMTHTEFSEVRLGGKDKARADAFYQGYQALTAEDIADAIIYCATRPLHVNIAEMLIYPSAQASANHIYKNSGVGGVLDE